MGRQLLILDIDETLVFATEQPLSKPHDFQVGPYHVYKRPHVDRFLKIVAEWFDLAVWTSSGEDYAAGALRYLFADLSVLKFVWSRQRCTRRFNHEMQAEYWLKDLKRLHAWGIRVSRYWWLMIAPRSSSGITATIFGFRHSSATQPTASSTSLFRFLSTCLRSKTYAWSKSVAGALVAAHNVSLCRNAVTGSQAGSLPGLNWTAVFPRASP